MRLRPCRTLALATLALVGAAGCSSHKTQGRGVFAVKKGMTQQEVREVAGPRHRLARGCWLYRASKKGTSIDAMRFCFTDGRVSLIQTGEHLGPQTVKTGLAAVIDLPSRTPRWLVERARLMASALGDPRPEMARIRLGRFDTVELWGHFVCDKTCTYPHGASPPRGTHAVDRIDPRDRGEISFSLNDRPAEYSVP